jgi:hypothetical protein
LKHFIKKTFKDFLTESDKFDDKVGKTFWFEYHCYESPDSCDAELWYRSHQQVKVIGVTEWSHDELSDRIEDATPRVYRIRFNDGFEGDAWEDELVNSPDEFYRPNPPQSETRYSEALINESFLDEPKFYRFSNDEMTGIEDGIYKPKNRKMEEDSDWNLKLSSNFNFPNMKNSVFLMDKIGYRIYGDKKGGIYGFNEYEITLDDSSNLGWSFFVMQGKWHSKSEYYFTKSYPNQEFLSEFPEELMNNKQFKKWNPMIQTNPSMNVYIKLLMKHKVIGSGNISKLLSSPFWGKVPCYVWTEDKVKINKLTDKRKIL